MERQKLSCRPCKAFHRNVFYPWTGTRFRSKGHFEIDAHHKELGSAQSNETLFGNVAAADVHFARLTRWFAIAGKGNQSLFRVEAVHSANFSQEVWIEREADAKYFLDY